MSDDKPIGGYFPNRAGQVAAALDHFRARIAELEAERDRLREVANEAHVYLCWKHQEHVAVEPENFCGLITDLHPAVYNSLDCGERDLWGVLLRELKARADTEECGGEKDG